jgi:hypothetical protein
MPDRKRTNALSHTSTSAPSGAQPGIRDNHTRGSRSAFLKICVPSGTPLSIVSACFSIYAFLSAGWLRFLYGKPHAISTLDPHKSRKRTFALVGEGDKAIFGSLNVTVTCLQSSISFHCI